MKTTHHLKLVEGKFLPLEAGKVLSRLFSYKINHHHHELFSNEERFGKDLSNNKKRIEELTMAINSLNEIIHLATQKQQSLQISCSVEIIVLDGE